MLLPMGLASRYREVRKKRCSFIMTTNDKDIGRNPYRPKGFERNGPVFGVTPPRNE